MHDYPSPSTPKTKLLHWILLATVLAAQTGLLVWQAWTVGFTYDEVGHIMASHAFWVGEDVLEPASTPVLQHWLSGWVAPALGLELNKSLPAWQTRSMYWYGYEYIATIPPETGHRLLFLSRLPFLLFPLGVTLFLFGIGREYGGNWGGIFLGTLGAFEPNLLAHGSLVKSDVAAGLALLRLATTCLKVWRRPSWLGAGEVSVAVVFAAYAKYSLFVFIPFAALVLFVSFLRRRRWYAALITPLFTVALVYFALLAAFRFQAQLPESEEYEFLYGDNHWSEEHVAFVKQWLRIPMPERLVRGFHYIYRHSSSEGQPSYFWGKAVRPEAGAPSSASSGKAFWYFPIALAVKTPVTLLVFCLAGFVFALFRIVEPVGGQLIAAYWLPGIVILALATQTRMLVGARYVLPATVLALAGSALVAAWLLRFRVGKWIAGITVGGVLAGTLSVAPNTLSYFNLIAGGPANGWKYLADSNIDWGQNLPQLTGIMREKGIERIQTSYFGLDHLFRYAPRESYEEIVNPFCKACPKPYVYEPQPGWYAISITSLLGYYWPPEYEGFFRRFQERTPDAMAGYSIYVYEVK